MSCHNDHSQRVSESAIGGSPRVLSGGLRECYRGVYESAIGGSPRVLSGGLRECYRGVSESAIRGSASMIRYCEVSQLKSARLGNLNDHRRKTHSKANITCKMSRALF